eukprot:gnl/TRDRNA2_/TRDRNA2_33379_c0_seq1.p2 gnl/TRDRNA2_/TRDRNA2_33379_c0~~gnl/TRDRNA2_/TRDRNA2_33379_c0_seq1.p2  ORF type:complete len:111 (-),score=22.28 gnl/TRDRNA2_/TRDRNA2_33379_c0_seq1:229-561(-)
MSEQALHDVTVNKFCVEVARALDGCLKNHDGRSSPCQGQIQEFEACVRRTMPEVTRLIKDASQHCPAEKADFDRCVMDHESRWRPRAAEEACKLQEGRLASCAAKVILGR